MSGVRAGLAYRSDSGVLFMMAEYTDRYVYCRVDYHTSRRPPTVKALISSDKVPVPAGPYSPGVTVGEWIFLSGQGGFDPNTGKVVSDDLVEQTEQTFNNIETVLEAAGASLDDVISCLVHLVDLADFPAFNAVYEQKFTGVKPVRTTVRADLVAGLLVEITVVARTS
jgi:2-iminobutanoate/2-iminopropanoate deaminase